MCGTVAWPQGKTCGDDELFDLAAWFPSLNYSWSRVGQLLFQVLFRIHCVPPCWVVLQPAGEPGHDAVVPTDALVVVEDVVVLAFYGDEGALAAKQLEGCEHLDALVDGHVGVSAAMHEEDGRVHLVGIEERGMTAVKLHIVPRVGVCCGGRAVGVAPVAEAPVTGRIADAGMAHGSGEDVGHGLQVHRHEAAVAGSHAPHLVGLDEGMFLAELLGALNDVVGCVVAVGIDVSRSELLSEAATA